MHKLSEYNIVLRLLAAVIIYVLFRHLLGAFPPLISANVSKHLGDSLLPSLIASGLLFLLPAFLTREIDATRNHQFLLWFLLFFGNYASIALEGAFFAPHLSPVSLFASLFDKLLISLALAALITLLFALPGQAIDVAKRIRARSAGSWLWRVLAGSGSYLLFYYIFGVIAYLGFTAPYYEAGIAGLTVPPAETVLKVELIRAPLIVLSVTAFALLLNVSRIKLAIISGLALAWVGGLVPLIGISHILPTPLIIAHIIEIFFQNFSTGVVVAYLFWLTPEKIK